MVTLVNGNLLNSTTEIIVHQVNCKGVANAGLAKKIMAKYPENLVMYKNLCKRKDEDTLLGTVLCVECHDGKIVANLFGQKEFGRDGRQYTRHGALEKAMKQLREFMIERGHKSIAFPYKMSCGLGGGDWEIVEGLIKEHFGDFDCYIYKL